ncbi:hypothetical protein [Streptomyces cinnamoneus]|uniref:Uncharacterized protein n=1 Tax=Streptomyces cinnamoneus TaxID=53446 RepID=A0A918TX62_STRCJ|nr:hypothetical protein [Streptomyces cinnamoneus]GHC64400.1 hypothetical protein GCM10010507_47170 [Streptomyces cinnamoneus]
MALRFIGTDPNPVDGECPTVWFDKDRHEFVFQGWKADEELRATCLETGPIPPSEAVVRLPARMAQMIREACDVAERARL